MKRFFILLIGLIFLGLASGQLLGKHVSKPAILVQKTNPTVTPTPVIFATPVNMKIPKLGIDTTVEEVGLDKDNNMDVPKHDMNVGWYQYGPKPGEMGNAVIAGHFDKKNGEAAVFYHLSDLSLGDEVTITDEKGTAYIFTVVSKDTYPVTNFPIQKIFGSASDRYVNLITCDGVWQPQKHIYADRLVIRTKLKE